MENKKYSLLIVDDENFNIATLTQILAPDYNLNAAKNGLDAIELAKKCEPDVILLDITMPGMDGYAVLIELKRDDKTRKIPVIFVTALGDPLDEEKGLYLGAAEYISKPFSAAIVKRRVQNQIMLQGVTE